MSTGLSRQNCNQTSVGPWATQAFLRELLRYARLTEGGFGGYAIAWPDHPITDTRQRPERPDDLRS